MSEQTIETVLPGASIGAPVALPRKSAVQAFVSRVFPDPRIPVLMILAGYLLAAKVSDATVGLAVGLISIGDVVKWRVSEYEREQEALREYIKTA